MSAFLKTPQYLFLQKLRVRLQALNTQNNYKKYKEHLNSCKILSKDKYKNIGWRDDLDDYAWAVFDESKFGPNMTCFGGFDEFSFYPTHILYMSGDLKTWVLKAPNGKIWTYNPEETKELQKFSVAKLQKIHEIKMTFDGTVLSGEERRDKAGRQDESSPQKSGGYFSSKNTRRTISNGRNIRSNRSI